MKRYNTPHRSRVIKTRLTEEEYAEFSERVTLCKMSQAEFIRQALIKSSIRPVITVSPVNDELLSAVGKLTAEYGKIGGNLNQIARCLNDDFRCNYASYLPVDNKNIKDIINLAILELKYKDANDEVIDIMESANKSYTKSGKVF